ncbi:MAG: hypothetical protein M5R36_11750 [Deltaproteobacteria bacterium]|nr:hypothetical protein [Deltaproteobacteria bacterium]
MLFHPDVQLDYLRGQSFGGAEDASSVGAAALLALHLSAYPVFLVGAGMGLFASAIVIPGVVLACAKWRTSWPVLLGAAVPLALLTVVAKKNGYYAGIVMPPLAVAAGMGLADTVAARRFLWAPIAAVALAGTAAVWMRAPTQVLPRAYDTVFQYKGLFNYRAEPLPPFAQRAVRALSETVDEACGDRPRCHIGIVGELPNEMEIVSFRPFRDTPPRRSASSSMGRCRKTASGRMTR